MTDELLQHLLEKISAMYDLDPEEVSGKGRDTRLREDRFINARQVFCLVAFRRGLNYSQIANFIGMHHSSVQYYVKDRPKYDNVEEIVHMLTDSVALIRETAERLAKEPDDEYLQKQMIRLIVNRSNFGKR